MLKMRARMYAQPKTEMMPMLQNVSSVRCAAASYPFNLVAVDAGPTGYPTKEKEDLVQL